MTTLSQSSILCALAAICVFWVWTEIEAAPVAKQKPFVANLEDLLRFRIHNKHDRVKRSQRDSYVDWSDVRRNGDDGSDDQSRERDDSPERSGGRSPGDGQWFTDRTTYRYNYRGSDSDPRFPSNINWRYSGRSGEGYDGVYHSGYGGSSRDHGGRSRGSGGRSKGHGGRSRGHGGRSRGHGGRSRGRGGRSRGRHSRERYGDHYGGRSGERSYSDGYVTRYGERYGTRYGDRYGTRYGSRYGDRRDTPTDRQSDAGRRRGQGSIIF